jgi:hypothetical protein
VGGRGINRGIREVERECVSVRGGKRKKERVVGQGMYKCVRGREMDKNRVGRERVRGMEGEIVGRGRCMREREYI